MRTHDLKKSDRDNIAYDKVDLANIFSIHDDHEVGKFFNLNRTLLYKNIDGLPPSFYNDYVLSEGDHWTLLAHKFYGDVNLWWFICKINDIFDPTEVPPAGTVIKIPTRDVMITMMEDLDRE